MKLCDQIISHDILLGSVAWCEFINKCDTIMVAMQMKLYPKNAKKKYKPSFKDLFGMQVRSVSLKRMRQNSECQMH